MTLAQWSEEYARLRALAVKAALDNDLNLFYEVGDKLWQLPSFHYEYRKEQSNG